MKKYSFYRNGIILGIIVLFTGASVIPSISEDISEAIDLVNEYGDLVSIKDLKMNDINTRNDNNSRNSTIIGFGETISASIDNVGETDNYTFLANDGDLILLRVSRSSGGLDPEVKLFAPNGSMLNESWGDPFVEFSSSLSTDGNYWITVGDYGGTDPGSYGLFIQRLNNPGNITSLNYGETIYNDILTVAIMDTYTFSGEKDDIILLRMSSTSYHFDPEMRLFAPNGSLVEQNYTSGETIEIQYTLPMTGTFTVLACDYGGTDPGSYGLFIQRLNNPGNITSLNYGETIYNDILTVAIMDTYTFSGEKDDIILLRMSSTSYHFDPEMRLFAPNGSLVEQNYTSGETIEIQYTLPMTGTFTVLACDYGGTDPGSYGLFIQRLNNPGNITSLNYGETIYNDILTVAIMDTYTFSGEKDDIILLRMSSTSYHFDPEMRLFAPNGSLVEQNYTSGETIEIQYTLPMTGTFTVLACDYGGTDGGSYSISLFGSYDSTNILLKNNWNLITIPFLNNWMASTLAENITGCQMISWFDAQNQTFKTHIVGVPGYDFEIKDGVGYFVYVDQNSTLTVCGPHIDNVSVPIYLEWNSIGWYHDYNTTASSLGENITGCSMVSWFDAEYQTFKTHIVGVPGYDFTINQGMGLFVYVDETSVWYG